MVLSSSAVNIFLVVTALAGAFIIFVLLPRNTKFAGLTTFFLGLFMGTAEAEFPGIGTMILGASWIIMGTGIYTLLYGIATGN